MAGWGWVAGSIVTKAISASNLKLKLTEAELGKKNVVFNGHYVIGSSLPPERRPLERRTLVPIPCSDP